ncbi:MAG: hypothetical protein RLZZ32_158 [Cyanobacteriota bacterium]|jgi:hypothetical protein
MPTPRSAPCWLHRGCSVSLVGRPNHRDAYLIRHRSGVVLGTAANLDAARLLIDQEISLLRQRLAACA